MNVLSLDTATDALGICLRTGEQEQLTIIRAGLKHAQTLLPRVQHLLQAAGIKPKDLDLIVCALGPGSFTGLRIGLASAKGLAMGTGCALTGISNLDALSHRYRSWKGVVIPVMRSLRTNYYTAVYRHGIRISDYWNLDLEALLERLGEYEQIFLTGPLAVEVAAEASQVAAQSGQVAAQSGQVAAQSGQVAAQSGQVAQFDAGAPPTDPRSLLELGLQRYGEKGPENNLTPLYLRKSEAEITLSGEK